MNCYASAVHDVLRAMGHSRCVLPPKIKALDPTKKLTGEVYTVSGHVDMTRDPHDTLVQWTGLLSKAPAGTVLVCQPNTYEIALMGELSAETLHFKGVRGYVVDGGSGDYLIGDRDGVVIIPGAIAEEAVTRTEAVMQTENQVRTAILAGMDPQEAYLKSASSDPEEN